MVAHPEEYRWSSFHATAGLEAVPEWVDAAGLLGNFGSDVSSAREEYRRFVEAGIGLEKRLWDDLQGQIYLGTAEWIDRIQKMIDEQPRSEEHPRAQRMPGRPSMDDVLEAVSATFDIKPEEIRQRSATTARQVAAWLAFEEGLIRQSEIAVALGIRRSRVSSLVIGCRRVRDGDPLRDLVAVSYTHLTLPTIYSV